MIGDFSFQMPTRIHFGRNIISKIGEETRGFGRKPFLVSGAMGKNSGALDKVAALLQKAGLEVVVFAEVEAQPELETMLRGAELAMQAGCDLVIGIGGECPLDAAKMVGLLARNPIPEMDLFGLPRLKEPALPVFAVPLTAGSGSEVTPFAAVTLRGSREEIRPVISPHLFPSQAFVDPTFTLAFPRTVTINNGLDALTHCVEGLICRHPQPLAESLALEGLGLVRVALPKVLEQHSQCLEERCAMSYAAMLGGIVTAQTGLGLVHQMGYALTVGLGLAHGAANGMVLPWVVEYALGHWTGSNGSRGARAAIEVKEALQSVQTFLKDFGFSPQVDRMIISADVPIKWARDIEANKEAPWSGARHVSTKEMEALFRNALHANT